MTAMLASVTGPAEAETALAGRVDIIDLKDPAKGALGAVSLETVRRTVKTVGGRRPASAVVGDLPPDARVIVPAVEAMGGTGVDFVKVGLFPGDGREACIRALGPLATSVRLVGVMFADRGADLSLLPLLAASGFAGAMIDTAGKGGGRLLDHMDSGEMEVFVARCRSLGLLCGLAGSLEAPDVPRLLAFRPDILGFRSALCRNHDRTAGLDPDAVAAIRKLIPQMPTAASGVSGHPDYNVLGQRGFAQESGDLPTTDRIFVRDLIMPISIGAYRSEQDRPQRVRFNVMAEVRRRTRIGDDMIDVMSYDVILDAIRSLAQQSHITLVETLAERIAARVLEHRQVRSVTVRVEKLDIHPGVVGVEIVRRRGSETATVHELFPTSIGGPKAAS